MSAMQQPYPQPGRPPYTPAAAQPPFPPGPPTPPGPRRRGLGIVVGVLTLALLASIGLNAWLFLGNRGGGETSFATPQEAVEFYVSAIGRGDLDKGASAYPTTTLARHHDPKRYLDAKQGTKTPYGVGPLPVDDPRVWEQQMRATAIWSTGEHIKILLVDRDEKLDVGAETRPDSKDQSTEEILAKYDRSRLDGSTTVEEVKVVRTLQPQFQSRLNEWRAQTGAEQVTEVVAKLSTKQGPFLLAVQVIRFDGRWFINSGRSLLALSQYQKALQTFAPIEEGEFEKAISDWESGGVTFES